MSKLEIFEPPMCCPSGECGSSADTELVRIAAITEALKKAEIDVARHDLSADPKAFMENEDVNNALNQRGIDVLPITVLDGRIVQSGRYPTNEEFGRLLGLSLDVSPSAIKTKGSSCNCGTKGCCS